MSYGWVFGVILLLWVVSILVRAWWMERPKGRPWWRENEKGEFIEVGRRRWR